MDDQQTYLLNGLLTRHFGLGRIVRFRLVDRGRQAEAYEVFTAQEKEYLVQLYPPTHSADRLDFVAGAVNLLDANRFTVMPFVPTKNVVFVAEGPQSGHMLVSLAPAGSGLKPLQYTEHDISQVGLRLAWMHRLLKEQLPKPKKQPSPADRFYDVVFEKRPTGERVLPSGLGPLQQLHGLLGLSVPWGWTHGDIQRQALLHDADHQLRAITDWGLLHYGCPLEDLVDAFLMLATDRKGMLDRGRGSALLEAYDSLVRINRTPWTPVVAAWCAQRICDDRDKRKPLPEGFQAVLANPERLATAMASCIKA